MFVQNYNGRYKRK